MSAAAARRAAVYRLLATGPLPSARDAIEALHQPQTAKVTMKEMAALLRSCVDDQGGDPAEDACVTECVRRLREAGDGGERHLDKRLASGVRIVPLAPEATGFNAWRREEEPNRSGGTAEWLLPEGAEDKAERVLFLHGGGYSWYSPSDVYRPFTTRLAAGSGLAVLAIDYRLAPEFAAPAALEDALAALRWLWAHGPGGEAPARRVLVVGDSAGGGLALSLLAELGREGQRPAGGFAWSPCADLSFSGASVQSNDATEHFFPARRVHDLAAMALGDVAAKDPRVSPLFAEFSDCPPVLIQASESEILFDDARRMAEVLRQAGGAVELETWAGAPHVWQIFDGWFPEARAAIASTARWISSLSDR